MAYKHGTYSQFEKSIGRATGQAITIPVYIGTAPVNLIKGYADLVNKPIKIQEGSTFEKVGYSSDWTTFTLCEALKLHFDNEVESIGPIVVINVLDPDTHRSDTQTQSSVTFVNNVARIKTDKVIMDTVTIEDWTEGTDFTTEYDFESGNLIINNIGSKGDSATVAYYEVDVTGIDSGAIIGGVTSGVYTGLSCVKLIYSELGLIPNILAAPGWSEDKDVYTAMIAAMTKVNGHWDGVAIADIPADTSTDTIEEAIAWKATNAYTSERTKVCWPQWQATTGEIYHLSTITAWRMAATDATHNGVPMETPSNKQIPFGKLYFGAGSANQGYDQQEANELNEKGITTATYWGGINVLWGNHTAAYEFEGDTDMRAIFDNSIRMMCYIGNSFQEEHGLTIDKPMTKALADTIKVREQEKADALVSMGALIGKPVVEFKQGDNPDSELMEGNFVWSNVNTPTPPFKSGTMKVAYTSDGFSTYFEGGEE